jgi:hypothetical protein
MLYGFEHLVVKLARLNEAPREEFALARLGIKDVLEGLLISYLLDQVPPSTVQLEQTAPLPLFL